MTTASRPTFDPAKGGSGVIDREIGKLSQQTSSKDLPSHLSLKERTLELEGRDFKAELEERERQVRLAKGKSVLPHIIPEAIEYKDDEEEEDDDDKGEDDDEDGEDDDEDYDEEDDDEEEDEAALLAELEKIKQERAQERERREKEEQEKKERQGASFDGPSSFSIKRPWDDDVPFKNCARGEHGKKKGPYINDTIRSESHKKFMDKYIK